MIETEKQRRWWFATHPEYSSRRTGAGGREHDEDDADKVRPEDVDAYVDEALKYQRDSTIIELLKLIKFWFGTEFESKTPAEQHALLWGDEEGDGDFGNEEDFDSQDPSLWENEARLGYDEAEKLRGEGPLTHNQGLKDGVQSVLDPNSAPNPPLVLNPDYVSGFYQGVDEAQREYRSGWTDGYGAIHSGKAPPNLDTRDNSAYAQGVRAGATTALDEQEERAQKWQDPIPFLSGSRHSRTLRKNLEDSGEPRQSPDEDGHHIVPWRHWRAQPARDVLEKYGIDIDAAENGVWAQRTYHWTLNNSSRYMDAVNRMLQGAGSKGEALQILREMKDLLSLGKFPL